MHQDPQTPSPNIQGALREDAFQGKTIVVTGGGTGLGRAMATYLLKLGANIVIASRKLDVLEQSAREMESETGGNVLAVACDVRQENEVVNLLQNTLNR